MPRSKQSDSYNSPVVATRFPQDMYDKVIAMSAEYGTAAQVVRVAVRDFFLRRDVANSNASGVLSAQTTDEVQA
jgi:hypothetical protein